MAYDATMTAQRANRLALLWTPVVTLAFVIPYWLLAVVIGYLDVSRTVS